MIARQEDLTEHLIRSSLKLDKSLPITSEAERERERQERLSVAWPTSSSARSSFLGGSPDPNGTTTPKAVSPITPPKDRLEAGSSPSAAVDQSARKDSPALRDINAQNASPASGTGSSILNTSPAGYSSSRPRIQGLGLGLNLSSSSKFTNGDQNVDQNVEVNEAKAASSKNGSGETTKSSQEISRWSLTTSSSPGAEEDVTASIMRRNEALNVLPTGLTAAGTSNLSLASSSKDNATPSATSPNPAQSNVNSKSQTPKTPKTPKSTQTARSRANSSSNGPPGPPPIGLPLPPLPPLPNDRTSPKTTGPPGLPLPPLPPNAQHQPHPNKAIPPPPPADEEEAARLEKEKEEFLAFQRNEALRSEAVDRERQRRRELELIKRDEAKRAEVMKRLAEEQEKEIGKRSAKASAPPVIKKDLNGERSRASSGPPPTSNGHAKGVSETDTARIRTLSHQVRGERGTASESISRIASPSHTLPPSTTSPPPVTRSRRQKDDDEGESWLQRHTRKQSEERVLGGMYSKVQPEKDLPTAPYVTSKSSRNQPSGSGGGVISDSDERLAEQAAAHAADARRRAEQMALAQIERARAEQRSLEFQLSEVERRNRERNEAEAAARARWVRQQAERERLDAFERSKLESAERLRREAVEKRNREEAHSAEEKRKEKAKKALEEKEAVEQAQRRRKDAEEREHRLKIEVARRKEREEEVRQRDEKKRLQRQSLMNKFESRTYDQTVVLSGSVTVQKSDATVSGPSRSVKLSIVFYLTDLLSHILLLSFADLEKTFLRIAR